jgi:hypothetical protein
MRVLAAEGIAMPTRPPDEQINQHTSHDSCTCNYLAVEPVDQPIRRWPSTIVLPGIRWGEKREGQ